MTQKVRGQKSIGKVYFHCKHCKVCSGYMYFSFGLMGQVWPCSLNTFPISPAEGILSMVVFQVMQLDYNRSHLLFKNLKKLVSPNAEKEHSPTAPMGVGQSSGTGGRVRV